MAVSAAAFSGGMGRRRLRCAIEVAVIDMTWTRVQPRRPIDVQVMDGPVHEPDIPLHQWVYRMQI